MFNLTFVNLQICQPSPLKYMENTWIPPVSELSTGAIY